MTRKKTSRLTERQPVGDLRDGADAGTPTTIASLAAEIARLRTEKAALREEIDILRRADPFFAKPTRGSRG